MLADKEKGEVGAPEDKESFDAASQDSTSRLGHGRVWCTIYIIHKVFARVTAGPARVSSRGVLTVWPKGTDRQLTGCINNITLGLDS